MTTKTATTAMSLSGLMTQISDRFIAATTGMSALAARARCLLK